MFENEQLTLLTKEQVWDHDYGNQLKVLKKYGTRSAISDLAILTGAYCDANGITVPDDYSLKGRTGFIYTQSLYHDVRDVCIVSTYGTRDCCVPNAYDCVIRPVLQLSSSVFAQITSNRVSGYNGTEEVEYLEYPQYVPDKNIQIWLESEFQNGRLQTTGKNYTFNKPVYYGDDDPRVFQALTHDEYEYNGRKYIRVKAKFDLGRSKFQLSNGEEYRNGDYVWVEVSPVRWLIDDKTKLLVPKIGLLSGIIFCTVQEYRGNFSTTDMKKYLDEYMSKDLFQNTTLDRMVDMTSEEKKKIEENQKNKEKERTPYEFDFGQVREEQVIKGSIDVNEEINELDSNIKPKDESYEIKVNKIKIKNDNNKLLETITQKKKLYEKLKNKILERYKLEQELKQIENNIKSLSELSIEEAYEKIKAHKL